MSAHIVDNSQCDLNMYGPDPGDGTIKCTCDEDAPVLPATTPRVPSIRDHRFTVDDPRNERPLFVDSAPGGPQHPHFGTGPHVVTLTGRAAATHAELREAGREYRLALEVVRRTEARYKAALDAHMQEIQ